jgi:hypothetical protein
MHAKRVVNIKGRVQICNKNMMIIGDLAKNDSN